MPTIQCPHCDEDIELDFTEGLFDCPHCDEEFSWGSETPSVESYKKLELWFGLVVPFLTMFLGGLLMFAIIQPIGYESIAVSFLAMLLWPITALGITIYGWKKQRITLAIGAGAPLAIGLFFLVVWATLAGIGLV
tara:strand:+ start:1341 stop:1745 length:405 start_codon:yes stop_codon:yes gene_type:complete